MAVQHYVVMTDGLEFPVDAVDDQDLLYQVALILGGQANTVETAGPHSVIKDDFGITAVATVWDA